MTLDFDLRPYEGVGPIDFGAPVEDVLRLLGPPDVQGVKELVYFRLGIQVAFDDDGRVLFASFVSPLSETGDITSARPVVTVFGLALAGHISAVVDQLGRRGYTFVESVGITVCDELGFYLAPDCDAEEEDEDLIEVVAAWRRGIAI